MLTHLLKKGALKAIGILDAVLERAAIQLATFGALTNRLKFSIATNSQTAQQTEIALGRAMDTDYAIETTNLVKAQILSQSANRALAGLQMKEKTFPSPF
jgi:flagellin